jgi:hypothetical protein
VVVHYDNGDAFAPAAEHGEVYDVGEASLRVICNSFAECGSLSSATKEPTAPSSKGRKVSIASESPFNVSLPSLVRGESVKVLWLELRDNVDWEPGLLGEGVGLAAVV